MHCGMRPCAKCAGRRVGPAPLVGARAPPQSVHPAHRRYTVHRGIRVQRLICAAGQCRPAVATPVPPVPRTRRQDPSWCVQQLAAVIGTARWPVLRALKSTLPSLWVFRVTARWTNVMASAGGEGRWRQSRAGAAQGRLQPARRREILAGGSVLNVGVWCNLHATHQQHGMMRSNNQASKPFERAGAALAGRTRRSQTRAPSAAPS